MSEEANTRLERLEELVAHLALSLEEMNGEMLRLRDAHADLARRHKALVTRLEAFEDAGGTGTPQYEKPPHY